MITQVEDLICFDSHATFEVRQACVGLDLSQLALVGGGGIDKSCGNNGACLNDTNDTCINMDGLCTENMTCFENAVCVS